MSIETESEKFQNGSLFTITYIVTNTSEVAAINTILTLTVPSNGSLVEDSIEPHCGVVEGASQLIRCELGDLPGNSSRTTKLKFIVNDSNLGAFEAKVTPAE